MQQAPLSPLPLVRWRENFDLPFGLSLHRRDMVFLVELVFVGTSFLEDKNTIIEVKTMQLLSNMEWNEDQPLESPQQSISYFAPTM